MAIPSTHLCNHGGLKLQGIRGTGKVSIATERRPAHDGKVPDFGKVQYPGADKALPLRMACRKLNKVDARQPIDTAVEGTLLAEKSDQKQEEGIQKTKTIHSMFKRSCVTPCNKRGSYNLN